MINDRVGRRALMRDVYEMFEAAAAAVAARKCGEIE